ncbi:MAG: RsmE family RNA methyltransferase [Elusimicrobiota bacterium]
MIKIFVDDVLRVGETIEINSYNQHHLQVVGKSPGEIVRLGDSSCKEYLGEILSFSKYVGSIKIKKEVPDVPSPKREVDLYISVPKSDKLEEVVFRCTQVGISKFIPVISERTVKKINARNRSKIYRRLEKKARHGAELTGREKIPSIGPPLNFREALKKYSEKRYGSGIFMWVNEKSGRVTKKDLVSPVALFIGPEGGYTDKEAVQAGEAGLKCCSLGPMAMDVETAAIVSSSQILLNNG